MFFLEGCISSVGAGLTPFLVPLRFPIPNPKCNQTKQQRTTGEVPVSCGNSWDGTRYVRQEGGTRDYGYRGNIHTSLLKGT